MCIRDSLYGAPANGNTLQGQLFLRPLREAVSALPGFEFGEMCIRDSTGVEASIQVKPSYGLTDREIASMIKDSMSYAAQDVKARMLAEQKVEAARVLESLHGALAADAAPVSYTHLAEPVRRKSAHSLNSLPTMLM